MCGRIFTAVLPAIVLLPAALWAQESAEIAELEARVAANPGEAEPYFALARALIEGLPTDRIVVMERMPAREQVRVTRLFEEALRHAPDEPRYLMGYAKWLAALGRDGEGERVLSRAMRGLEELGGTEAEGDAKTDSLLHAGHRLHARLLMGRVEDNRYLVRVPNLPITSPDCDDPSLFCRAYRHPGVFNSLLREAQEASGFLEGPREELVELLEGVFARDPADVDALKALASERFASEEWEDAARAARAHLEAAPGSAWAHLALGTAQWRSGEREGAADALAAGFDALPEAVRSAWRDPDRVLPSEAAGRLPPVEGAGRAELGEAYWARVDPLLLTDHNERWLEHLAREVYAELRFGVPERELAGRDTERGDVYLRLGHPRRIVQVRRDASRELTRDELARALAGRGFTKHAGGRWTFWVYAEQGAPFIFEAPLRGREPRHKFDTRSRNLAEKVARVVGSLYEPPFAGAELAVQAARFRGREADETELVLAPERPRELEGAPVLRSGLFVVDMRSGRRSVERAGDGPPQLLYALRLPAGASLWMRLEVLAGVGDAADEADPVTGPRSPGPERPATWEAATEVEPWEEGLALSDLLLARRVTARGEGVASWRDLHFEPLPALEIAPGDSLGVVFELYGLETDRGLASYEVRVELAERDGRSLGARVLGALGRALGLGGERGAPVLEWTREAELANGRVVEYFTLVSEELGSEPVELRVEITDLVSGQVATATRTLEVRSRD